MFLLELRITQSVTQRQVVKPVLKPEDLYAWGESDDGSTNSPQELTTRQLLLDDACRAAWQATAGMAGFKDASREGGG